MRKTILCYGDSNTYGYNPANGRRYARDVRWPGRLRMLLGDEYAVIEEGCNGRTTVFDDPEEPWKNGLPYLRPCLNTHKPIDIVILMLGSNDLKTVFHLNAQQIADGAGQLVDVIRTFTADKQGYVPDIILVSPPEIGPGIRTSAFYGRFSENAVGESQKFAACYKAVARQKGCIFVDAAQYAAPSEADSLHLTAEGHAALADKLCEVVQNIA